MLLEFNDLFKNIQIGRWIPINEKLCTLQSAKTLNANISDGQKMVQELFFL